MNTNTIEATRGHVHAMWASVASRWEDHADDVELRASGLTDALLADAGLQGDERVLELACGPGGAGLAFAAALDDGGQVVLSDVVPEMVAIAERRAAAAGRTNVRTAVLDLEAIDEPDSSFDVVVCREGLMFAVEPERAAAEVRRVLRPGGRAVVSVWGERVRNPWLGLLLDAVADEVGMSVPPPHVPGPFALGDDGRLAGVLAAGGFSQVSVREGDVPLVVPSFEGWWQRMLQVAGPVAGILAGLPEERRDRIQAALRAAVAPFAVPGETGFVLPGVVLIARAVA